MELKTNGSVAAVVMLTEEENFPLKAVAAATNVNLEDPQIDPGIVTNDKKRRSGSFNTSAGGQ